MADETAPWDTPAPEKQKRPAAKGGSPTPAEVAPWDAAAQEQFLKKGKKETWSQFGGKMIHEAAMGIPFADRIAAGAQTLMGRGPYGQNLENIRSHSAQYEQEHPWAGMGAQMAGSLLTPLPAMGAFARAGRVGKAIGAGLGGAGFGLASGISGVRDLSTREGWREAAEQGVRQSAIGGLLGSGAGALFHGPQKLTPTALPAKQAAGAVKDANPIAAAFKDQFGWGTESAKAAQAQGREALGTTARNTAIRKAETEPFQREYQNLNDSHLLPGTLARMNATLGTNPAAAEKVNPAQLAFMDYIQGRTTKGTPFPFPNNPQMQKLADVLRDQHQAAIKRIQALPPEWQAAARQDYLKGAYENPAAAVGTGPRGISGGFRKGKVYDNYNDAIRAGLVPKTGDAVQLTAHATANSDQWATRYEWFDKLKKSGQVRFARANNIPDGFAAIEGFDHLSRGGRFAPIASRDVAQVFNADYSRGLDGIIGKDWMDGIRTISNATKQMELGFSGFHAITMAHEFSVSETGRAITELGHGHPIEAAKAVLGAGSFGLGTALPWSKSSKLIKEYLKPGSQDPLTRQMAELATSVNFHVKPTHLDLLQTEAGGAFGKPAWESAKQGTLGRDVMAGAGRIAKDWGDRPVRMALQSAIGAAVGGLGAQQAGLDWRKGAVAGGLAGAGGMRPMQKAAEAWMTPIFQGMVPHMKAGSFYNRVETFMRLNPGASKLDLQAAARVIADSTDNRFGEMVRDNLFWRTTSHDVAQIMFLSPTWQIGTIREIAGAYPQLFEMLGGGKILESGQKAQGLNAKLEYVMGFMTQVYAMGNLYEYFATQGGHKPDQPVMNTGRDTPGFAQMHPRTGGIIPSPEGSRAKYQPQPFAEELMWPGYGKDILAARETIKQAINGNFDPFQTEIKNKFSPMVHGLTELMTGHDWTGKAVADPREGLFGNIKARLGAVGKQFMPIGFQQAAKAEKQEGSNIPWWANALGFRRAGKQYYDPEGYEGLTEYLRMKNAGLEKTQPWAAQQKVKSLERSEKATRGDPVKHQQAEQELRKAQRALDKQEYGGSQ